jgi:hypothetical protein
VVVVVEVVVVDDEYDADDNNLCLFLTLCVFNIMYRPTLIYFFEVCVQYYST